MAVIIKDLIVEDNPSERNTTIKLQVKLEEVDLPVTRASGSVQDIYAGETIGRL